MSDPARAVWRAILGLLMLSWASIACAADGDIVPVPPLNARVTDLSGTLNGAQQAQLEQQLAAFEQARGGQIAILFVPTTQPEAIEQYAIRVAEAWKIGRRKHDDGVLVVVAKNDRKIRIEVGYGLEGTLTDVAASRIVRNVMTPRFKAGDFDAGVSEGVAAVIGQLTGTAALPADEPRPAAERKSDKFFDGPELSLPERILIGAFIFGIIGLFTVLGVLTPGMGWFLYFFLIPFWAMFPIVVVGTTGALYLFGTYLVVFPIAKILVSRQPWYEKARQDIKTKGSATIGGFTVGGRSGGSSWSSGSSSGGGFSGGGGSSGGGGASGSW